MGSRDDAEYFESRAEAEIQLAQEAGHASAVRAHYIMAGIYLDRVHGPGEVHNDTRERVEGGAEDVREQDVERCLDAVRADYGDEAALYAASRADACRMSGNKEGESIWWAVARDS